MAGVGWPNKIGGAAGVTGVGLAIEKLKAGIVVGTIETAVGFAVKLKAGVEVLETAEVDPILKEKGDDAATVAAGLTGCAVKENIAGA